VADVNKAGRRHVEEKAANELDRLQSHRLGLVASGVVLPFEGDPAILHLYQSPIGNSNAVRVAGQILENLFRPAEGTLGVNHPFQAAGLLTQCLEGGRLGQRFQFAVEL